MIKIFDIDYWQEIWATISRNKLRSFLTGFGVAWGIFMLVFLIGFGNGLEKGMADNFKGIAPNTSFFWTDRTSEPYKGYRKGRFWNMNNRDISLIRQKAQSVEYVSPVLTAPQYDKNVTKDKKSGSYNIQGIYPEHFLIQKQRILYGRTFNQIDIEKSRKVCVIGKVVYETLFRIGENPVGEYIRVNGIYFQIIGVISPQSADVSIGGNPESIVSLPFTTLQRAFNMGDVVHFLACTAKPGYPASMVKEEVSNILKTGHEIAPNDKKAIGNFNLEDVFKMFDLLFGGLNIVIGFVGIGTLLSGIVGISNIMLVTIRERTREIGVRRALGAKPITIIAQILSESFVLTAVSGFAGLMLGVLLLSIGDILLSTKIIDIKIISSVFISFKMAILALTILVFSGILAGLMPAMRALKVKAIDAIREE